MKLLQAEGLIDVWNSKLRMTECIEWKSIYAILTGLFLLCIQGSYGQVVSVDSAYATYFGSVVSSTTKEPVEATIRYESLPYSSMIGIKRGSKVEFPMNQRTDYLITVKASGYNDYVTTVRNAQIRDHELHHTIELTPNRANDIIRLEKLIFGQGQASISSESYEELDDLAEMLHENPSMTIQLEGHTDFRGNEKENIKLSEKRVDAVKDYLMDKGINGNRIKTKAFGGSQPLSRDSDAESRRSNRRVEVRILSN